MRLPVISGRSFRFLLAPLLLLLPLSSAAGERPQPRERDRPTPSEYRPLPRTDTFIRDATLLDGKGRKLEGADILIRDGVIAAVGSDLAEPAGVRSIEARGLWVTPGIVDVHSHNGTFVAPLTSNDSDASDVSEIGSPNAAGTWIEHAINVQDPAFFRALESGVTTLQVLPGSVPLIGGRSVVLKPVPANRVAAMKFPGASQGVKLSCGENPKSHFGSLGRSPNSRMGEIEALREIFARAAMTEADKGTRQDDLEHETVVAILAGDLPVHVHCYRADDIAVMMDLAEEFGFRIAAIHHATEAYKISELFRKNGVCAVLWSDWWGFKTEAADGIRAAAAFLNAAGACVALHSDSPSLGQRLNLEAAKAMAAGRRQGIEIAPEKAIAWITAVPARILGLDDRIGTVEAGKNADLVLWSGNPFSVYSRTQKVFVDGAVAFDRTDPQRQPSSDFELGRPASGPVR